MKLLASLALASTALTGTGSGGERADLVTKVYDLSTAAPELDVGAHSEAMLPCLRHRIDESGESTDVNQETDTIAQLVLSTFEREFQYEGRSLEVDSRGRMHVVAPAAIHKDIASLMALFESVSRRSVELRVDLIERPAGAPLLPALMALDEAEKLVAGSPAVRTANLSIAPGRVAIADATHTLEVVCDYDLEIAQSATIADPVVDSFPLGSRIAARAAAVRGGVQLAAIVKDAKLAKPLADLELSLGGMLAMDSRVERLRERSVLRLPSVLQRSVALSVFVPEGQAAVVETAASVQSGATHVAIVLRPTVVGKEPIAGVALSSSAGRVEVVDLSSLAPPRVRLEGPWSYRSHLPEQLKRVWLGDEGACFAYLDSSDTSMLESAFGNDPAREFTSAGPWLFARSKSDAAAEVPALTTASPIFASAEPVESVSLALTLRRGTSTLAQWSAPFTAGEWSAAYLGGEALAVIEVDVEVAQNASAFDPTVGCRPDGVALSIRPSRAQDGSWSVELIAFARILATAPTTMESIGALDVPIETPEYDDMWIEQRVTLGAKARKVLLGMTGSLQLEVELR